MPEINCPFNYLSCCRSLHEIQVALKLSHTVRMTRIGEGSVNFLCYKLNGATEQIQNCWVTPITFTNTLLDYLNNRRALTNDSRRNLFLTDQNPVRTQLPADCPCRTNQQ